MDVTPEVVWVGGLQYAVASSSTPGTWRAVVADVGEDAILVHDEEREDPGLAFALSRLSRGPYEPTPIGVFRAVRRPEYGASMAEQLADAQERRGVGDLKALLRSGATWTVG